MTSQPDEQTIAICILPNTSRSKGKQTMKFGQVIKNITTKIFFLKNNTENKAERLDPGLFFFFKKALDQVKVSSLKLSFNIFRFVLNSACNKNNLYKTRDMFNFRSGTSFATTICVWFLKKIFSHILLTDQILLRDFLYFLRFWSISVLQLFVNQVVTS